jgi:multidrug efflux pump subunit AcrA (membrane-fusion protein)
VIPSRAVLDVQGVKMVYVVGDDHTAQNRRVTLGATLGSEVVVDEGLVAGERVITDGLVRVRPGMAVSERASESPAETTQPVH